MNPSTFLTISFYVKFLVDTSVVYLFFTDILIIFFKRIKAIFVQIERIKRFVQAFNKDGIGHHASFISDQFFFIKLTLFFSFR